MIFLYTHVCALKAVHDDNNNNSYHGN